MDKTHAMFSSFQGMPSKFHAPRTCVYAMRPFTALQTFHAQHAHFTFPFYCHFFHERAIVTLKMANKQTSTHHACWSNPHGTRPPISTAATLKKQLRQRLGLEATSSAAWPRGGATAAPPLGGSKARRRAPRTGIGSSVLTLALLAPPHPPTGFLFWPHPLTTPRRGGGGAVRVAWRSAAQGL